MLFMYITHYLSNNLVFHLFKNLLGVVVLKTMSSALQGL